MLITLATITLLFSVILFTHNWMLEAASKDAANEPKSHVKATN